MIHHEGQDYDTEDLLPLTTGYEAAIRRHTQDKEHALAGEYRAKLDALTAQWIAQPRMEG